MKAAAIARAETEEGGDDGKQGCGGMRIEENPHGGAVGVHIRIVVVAAGGACAEDFAEQVDLSPLATMAVQHNQTMKTLDTFARQAVWEITGHEKLDGHVVGLYAAGYVVSSG